MKIDTNEQLEALVKLCRKLNVEAIEIDGIKLTLGDAPKRARKGKDTSEIANPDELTEDQLLFWSSEPRVGSDG